MEYDRRAIAREKLKSIKRKLLRAGWKLYYTSKHNARVSSYYFERRDQNLRLSDHELPETAEREYYSALGQRRGWDYELIVSSCLKSL